MEKKFKLMQVLILLFVIIMGILWLIFWRRDGIEFYLVIISLLISLITLGFIFKSKI